MKNKMFIPKSAETSTESLSVCNDIVDIWFADATPSTWIKCEKGMSLSFCETRKNSPYGKNIFQNKSATDTLPKMEMIFSEKVESTGTRIPASYTQRIVADFFHNPGHHDVFKMVDKIFFDISAV